MVTDPGERGAESIGMGGLVSTGVEASTATATDSLGAPWAALFAFTEYIPMVAAPKAAAPRQPPISIAWNHPRRFTGGLRMDSGKTLRGATRRDMAGGVPCGGEDACAIGA
ncbi:MAG: hypothetical protein ACM3ZE_22720, partial [Myxococcales bacterium]